MIMNKNKVDICKHDVRLYKQDVHILMLGANKSNKDENTNNT